MIYKSFLSQEADADIERILWQTLQDFGVNQVLIYSELIGGAILDLEENLILNSVVLLKDSAGMKIDPETIKKASWSKLGGLVQHRVEYLLNGK